MDIHSNYFHYPFGMGVWTASTLNMFSIIIMHKKS